MGKHEIVEETEKITGNFTEDFTIEKVEDASVNFTDDVTLFVEQENKEELNDYHAIVRQDCIISHTHKLLLCESDLPLVLQLPHTSKFERRKIVICNGSKLETVKLVVSQGNQFRCSLNSQQYMLGATQSVTLFVMHDHFVCV